VEIDDIIAEDETLLVEASHLVQETSELLNKYVWPLVKYWFVHRGELPSNSIAAGGLRWNFYRHTGQYALAINVPSYWKIPRLRNNELYIHMTLKGDVQREPISKQLGYTIGAADSKNRILYITVAKYSDTAWEDKRFLSNILPRLKAHITHELEHFADERIGSNKELMMNYRGAPKGKVPLEGHLKYLLHPFEIRAYVSDIIVKAKKEQKPFPEAMEYLLSRIKDHFRASSYTDKVEPMSVIDEPKMAAEQELDQAIEKIRTAWTAEYNRRRYGKR
jgi:hypothetical protein